jgi:hypothetical protein
MKVRAVLLLVAVFASFYLVVQHHRAAAERRQFSALAGRIAGRPVSVHCDSATASVFDSTPEEGFVMFGADARPGNVAYLKHWVCNALARFTGDARSGRLGCLDRPAGCSKDVTDDAFALHVLVHESWHLNRVASESDAECHALRTTAWAAQQFGANAQDAALVERYAWTNLLPQLPIEYHDAACGAVG